MGNRATTLSLQSDREIAARLAEKQPEDFTLEDNIDILTSSLFEKQHGQKVGYIRVSTVEQNYARQVEALKQVGVDKVYSEKVSGKDLNRPELKKMLDYVRSGDTIYVAEWSRISRNTIDLISTVESLTKKGVKLISLKPEENFDVTGPQGKLFLGIIASLSEFERSLIKERQMEGIAAAKAQGKHLGRPFKEYKDLGYFDAVCCAVRENKLTKKKAIKMLQVSMPTFLRDYNAWLERKHEEEHKTSNNINTTVKENS